MSQTLQHKSILSRSQTPIRLCGHVQMGGAYWTLARIDSFGLAASFRTFGSGIPAASKPIRQGEEKMGLRAIAGSAALCASAALLSGCMGNGYADFYTANAAVTPQDIAERGLAPAPTDPELVRGSDPKVDLPAAMADGYAVIGSSSFNGPQANDANAVAQAKVVGADRVITFNKYARTAQSVVPITTPTAQTSFSTGSANIVGSAGMATAFGSATTTTYGTDTTYVPISVDRYDYLAVYLVRAKSILGAPCRDLNNEEARATGSVNGAMVVGVVHGSPAAEAGLLPGDAILAVDGQPVIGQKQLGELTRSQQGRTVSILISRAGTKLRKTVNLATL
jgi:PDZ domain